MTFHLLTEYGDYFFSTTNLKFNGFFSCLLLKSVDDDDNFETIPQKFTSVIICLLTNYISLKIN